MFGESSSHFEDSRYNNIEDYSDVGSVLMLDLLG